MKQRVKQRKYRVFCGNVNLVADSEKNPLKKFSSKTLKNWNEIHISLIFIKYLNSMI